LACMFLGVETDTQDLTGKVVNRSDGALPEKEAVYRSAECFVGSIEQQPPAYSAIKIDGRRSYKAARKGQLVSIPTRSVSIKCLNVLSMEGAHVRFRVSCSKGTYIRTLASDWGRKLGCGAHLVELRRIRSGPFSLHHAVKLEDLEQEIQKGSQTNRMVDLAQALSHWPELRVDERTVQTIRQGRQFRDMEKIATLDLSINDRIRVASEQGDLIAIMKPVFDTQMEHIVELRSLRIFSSLSS